MTTQRIRVRFSKIGDLRMISHRDLVRAFERLFRRARVVLAMSQGFHPRPLMTFPDALSLGIEAHDEAMDISIEGSVDAAELQNKLAELAPPGLIIRSISLLVPGQPKARLVSTVYQIRLPEHRVIPELHDAIAALQNETELNTERRGKQITIDLRATLQDLRLEENCLTMRIRMSDQKQLQARDILAQLGLHELVTEGSILTRTKVELAT